MCTIELENPSWEEQQLRILIVDDDEDFAESLNELLHEHQFNTTQANTYRQAVELAQSFRPQVVLLDIRLGRSNGVDLMQEIKKLLPQTQVIVLTGYASLDTAIGALRFGAYDYLTKPPHPEELLLTVERCFESLQFKRRHEQTRLALELSEKKYRGIFNCANDCIIVTDEYGIVEGFNKAAEAVFGYQEQDVVGDNIKNLLEWHPFNNPQQLPGNDAYPIIETRAFKKDASVIPVQLTLSKTQVAQGLVNTYIIRDISEQKKTERQIRRLNQELEQRVVQRTAELQAANRELEAFCYSVSHDLRAPLRRISGFSAALLEDYQEILQDTGKDYLHRVCNATRHMGQLIDDLLSLSGVARCELSRETVDLSEISRELRKKYLEPARQTPIDFAIDSTPPAQGDESLVRIVLDNLFGNACKYSGKIEHVKIRFGYIQQDNTTVYFVSDNGVGFDMQYADKLFSAFHRLHSNQEFEGTGIGLATVQRIIHRHGGKIWAHSEEGKGATFYFTLQ